MIENNINMNTEMQNHIFEKWKSREFVKEGQNTNENSDELFFDAIDPGGHGESGYSSPCPNNDSENEEDENIKNVLSKVNVKDFYRIEMVNDDTYVEDPYISKEDRSNSSYPAITYLFPFLFASGPHVTGL